MMNLARDGALHLAAALSEDEVTAFEACLLGIHLRRAGTRLNDLDAIAAPISSCGYVGRHAATLIGDAVRPVRAILFNKTPGINWQLGWHQDRTIAVRARRDTPGFSNWNRKNGVIHVEPPFDLLQRMLTVRIHIDDVDEENAPLLISPGTHRLGRVPEDRIGAVVEAQGVHACLAKRGDIWAYSTPIIHASRSAVRPRSWGVLQIDYSVNDLPNCLEWAGV